MLGTWPLLVGAVLYFVYAVGLIAALVQGYATGDARISGAFVIVAVILAVFSTGLGLDAPLPQSNVQSSVQFLPDVNIEWLINPSGTLRATFFYRENADYLTTTGSGPGKARRYGSSLAYRKDFDRLGDLFRRRKKFVAPLPPPEEIPPTEIKTGTDEPKKE